MAVIEQAAAATTTTVAQDGPNSVKSYTILALYQFVTPLMTNDQVLNLKTELDSVLHSYFARGTILIATEGINGTISYPSNDAVLEFLQSKFPRLRIRISHSPNHVFHRLRVRVKNEIVTMGEINLKEQEEKNSKCEDGETTIIHPTDNSVGQYVKSGPEWNALLEDPDCLVVDARNDYEVQIGTFQNAVNPKTESFVELPKWLQEKVEEKKPSKIAMFCTGGIRCEKSTSYCRKLLQAYQDIPVYHLEGGILAYLDTVPESQSKFEGECFVFDQRTAVAHGLEPSSIYTLCHACRHPLNPTDRQSSEYEHGVCCPYCIQDENRIQRRQRYLDRQKQINIVQQQQQKHNHHELPPHLHDAKELKIKEMAEGEGPM